MNSIEVICELEDINMERIFPTFCHISDYDEVGFGLIPQMLESSYPLILWAPPGARVNDYYNQRICPISPEKLIHFVEQGNVQIMGRENWLLDEQYRRKYAEDKSFAKWCYNFDGALKSIWRDQQSIPEHERSVHIASEEDGWRWASDLLEAEPERIDSLWERIEKKQVPQVSLKRIREKGYGEKDKYQAVLQVLRDARDHTKAIYDADVEMPFLLQEKEGKFFSYLERGGRSRPLHKDRASHAAVSSEFTQEVHRLLERLREGPEKVSSLDEFIGSEAHKDLAKWLRSTVHLAKIDWSKQELRKFMSGQLKRDVEAGLPPERVWNILGVGQAERGATVGGLITGIASLFFSSLAFDPSTALTLTGLAMNVVPIVSGISQRLGIIKPDYRGPQWPYLVRFSRTPRKWDFREVRAILDTYIADLNEN